MAFKLTQTPKFKTLVTVRIANESGGFDKSTFIAEFKRPSASELKNLREAQPNNDEVVRKYLVGWEMKDADSGDDVPFNDSNLDAMLAITSAPLATALAFFEANGGARSKNFD